VEREYLKHFGADDGFPALRPNQPVYIYDYSIIKNVFT
jgi:hypothetical protein